MQPSKEDYIINIVKNNLTQVLNTNEDVKKVLDPVNNTLLNKLVLSGMCLKDAQTIILSYLLFLADAVFNFDLKK